MPLFREPLSRMIPNGGRLLRIVWPFLGVVALLVLLGVTSIDILSAVRAYVGSEGLWSKAQKEAVYYLNRYAATRSDADYRRYQEAIAVPLGDRKAREELEKPQSRPCARASGLPRRPQSPERYRGHDLAVPPIAEREPHRPRHRDLDRG